MKEMCDYCEALVELEEVYTTTSIRLDDETLLHVEVKCKRCPKCGDGRILPEYMGKLYDFEKMLMRGKYKLLHWTDIREFQKMAGWTDEQLASFLNEPVMYIEARTSDDEPLSLENDKKLREKMKEYNYVPKWDKIEM